MEQIQPQDIFKRVTNKTKFYRNLPVIVPKGNDIKLCVEMRCVNKVVICLRHPSPVIDDILISVQGSTSFSKLALKSEFYQLLQHFKLKREKKLYKRLLFGV